MFSKGGILKYIIISSVGDISSETILFRTKESFFLMQVVEKVDPIGIF